MAAAFARGDTSRAGLRERVPAPPRVGLFEVVVILALAVVLGVCMLLGLELGALLALLPRRHAGETVRSQVEPCFRVP